LGAGAGLGPAGGSGSGAGAGGEEDGGDNSWRGLQTGKQAGGSGGEAKVAMLKEVSRRLEVLRLRYVEVKGRKTPYPLFQLASLKDSTRKSDAPALLRGLALVGHTLHRKERREVTPLQMAREFFMSTLNKLSAENFDALKKELIGYNVVSHSMFEAVVQVVFDKALDDVKFQDLYAKLCLELGQKAQDHWGLKYLKVAYLSENQAPSGAGWYYTTAAGDKPAGTPLEEYEGWTGPWEVDASDAAGTTEQSKAMANGLKKVNFKRTIMDMCEREFKDKAEYDKLDRAEAEDVARHARGEISAEELEAERHQRTFARSRAKKRVMSNISFIGQLYIVDPIQYRDAAGVLHSTGSMVRTSIIRFCCSRLLHSGKTEEVEEEDVECLCRLLSLCGKKLEEEEKAGSGPDAKLLVPVYMDLLTQLGESKRLGSRVRFLAKNIVEMRREGWKLRGAAATIEFQQRSVTKQEAREAVMSEENAHRQRLLEGSREIGRAHV
jgi:hypothetical protein